MEWKKCNEKIYGSFFASTNLSDENFIEDGRTSESEEGEEVYINKEVDFDFEQYLVKFGRSDVIKW